MIDIKTLLAPLAVVDGVPRTVFTRIDMGTDVWEIFLQFIQLLLHPSDLLGGQRIQRRFLRQKFLSSQLFVEDAVFSLPETEAHNAVFASAAIFDHETITAVVAVQEIVASVALLRCHTLGAPLAGIDRQAVRRVLGENDKFTIEAVFVVGGSENEVAILLVQRVIRVFAIFHIRIVQPRMGHGEIQRAQLIEERMGEITFLPVCHWIPCIAEPLFLRTGFVGIIRRKHRHHRFPAYAGIPFVEFSFIAEEQPSLQPAGRALHR